MKWNPFAKDDQQASSSAPVASNKNQPGVSSLKKPEDMNLLQRLAYKRLMAMKPGERAKLMQKMMTPKNVKKHEKEIREQIEALKKSGQVSDDQIRLMKARLGLK